MKRPSIWALGAMSGTSLDGVDAAMLLTDGDQIEAFGPHAYRPYSEDERATIAAAFGQWQDGPNVTAAAEVVEAAHAELLSRFSGAEILGFHGQTLAHDPAGRGTHQCGNGGLLAELLTLTTVWDFRSTDVALGGQGAPLVPFFHHACARFIGATEPLAILNLGGVGNITWVDPSHAKPEEDGAVLAFDTGPANAPINDLMLRQFGRAQDEGGAFAATGQVDESFLQRFLDLSFFYKMPPKSLDRNAFDQIFATLPQTDPASAAATLTAAAAASVAKATDHFPKPITRLLVSGGGRHNQTMMQEIATRLPNITVSPIETVGLNGDMLEAQAFAYLAVRVARGLPTSGPSTTGVASPVGGGKIARAAKQTSPLPLS